MVVSIGSQQWIGERERQEDSLAFATGPDGRSILVLGDGMGGHSGGDVASKLAASFAIEALLDPYDTIGDALKNALFKANSSIAEHTAQNFETEGMGTTLVCAVINNDQLWWSSVGDSHLYLLRQGDAKKLNADHSMKPVLQKMVAEGDITAEQAASDPKRNALRSAIMGGDLELVDVSKQPIKLQLGDIVIICSDGVDTLGDENNIEEVIRGLSDPNHIADRLIEKVKSMGAPRQDNTSVLVATVKPDDDTGVLPKVAKAKANSKSHGIAKTYGFIAIFVAMVCLVLLFGFLNWTKSKTLAEQELLLESWSEKQSELEQYTATLEEQLAILQSDNDGSSLEVSLISRALGAENPSLELTKVLGGLKNPDLKAIVETLVNQHELLVILRNEASSAGVFQTALMDELQVFEVALSSADIVAGLTDFISAYPGSQMVASAKLIVSVAGHKNADIADIRAELQSVLDLLDQKDLLLSELEKSVLEKTLAQFIKDNMELPEADVARVILERISEIETETQP